MSFRKEKCHGKLVQWNPILKVTSIPRKRVLAVEDKLLVADVAVTRSVLVTRSLLVNIDCCNKPVADVKINYVE